MIPTSIRCGNDAMNGSTPVSRPYSSRMPVRRYAPVSVSNMLMKLYVLSIIEYRMPLSFAASQMCCPL